MKFKVKKSIVWEPNSRNLLHWEQVHTVCEESRCPNRFECSQDQTATFLIGGSICTRQCRFCHISSGEPLPLKDIQELETQSILNAVKKLQLQYIVITSVTRDDDPAGLAHYFADLCTLLKKKGLLVELLIPDFDGREDLIDIVVAANPDTIAHNVETVKRLSKPIRLRGSHKKSIKVLKHCTVHSPKINIKTGFMVGLGETEAEIFNLIEELGSTPVDVLTIGQYLRPSVDQINVSRQYTVEDFKKFRDAGLKTGIKVVESDPFVRSSYKAYESWQGARLKGIDNEQHRTGDTKKQVC